MQRGILPVVLVLTGSLTACGGAHDAQRADAPRTTAAPVTNYGTAGSAAPGKSGSTAGQGAASGTATLGDPAARQRPTMRVLEPGAEPKRKLRYNFAASRDEWMTFELKMTVTLSAPSRPQQRIQSPVLAMTLRMRGDEVLADGSLRASYAVERMEVLGDPSAEIARLRDEAAKVAVARGTFTVNPRGEMTGSTITVPPGTTPLFAETLESLRDGIRSLFTPLPEEAVGKGARWEVRSKQQMPTSVDVKTTVSLVDLDAARARVTMVSELSAQPGQSVNAPGAPPDVKMAVDSLTGSGSGSSSFAFDKLSREGSSKLSVTVNVHAVERTRDITFSTKTEIDTAYRPSTAIKK